MIYVFVDEAREPLSHYIRVATEKKSGLKKTTTNISVNKIIMYI